MIRLDPTLTSASLLAPITRLWQASAAKIRSLENSWDPAKGAPVFTVNGKYTSRGWTEWTQGFQFGSAILQFDGTGDEWFLAQGRAQTVKFMAPHITHVGVHDHGFNNVSTYGNLLRLMNESRLPYNQWEHNFYTLALKATGAIQAARWSAISEAAGGGGYIYSFNGPHSLFVDTIRSLRALAVSHKLGHVLMGENDKKISLLDRLLQHAHATARFSVFYGKGRDAYDTIPGRTVHEVVFNTNDGNPRCPSSQQGYSPFTTWTRGLAWALLGFPEQIEFLQAIGEPVPDYFYEAAHATANFFIEQTPTCGVPYWDTGAPNLHKLGDYLNRPADPFNDQEPVDSSAAAIAAQGLLRLGKITGDERYTQAGLATARTLFDEPYLSTDPNHQGLLLHAVYHRPNGWDNVPHGRKQPCNESCMWGDYHLRELALYIQRLAESSPYLTFF